MWKLCVLFLVIVPNSCIANWKPIVGPSSFAIKQKLPLLGDGTHIRTTYHGNAFLDDFAIGGGDTSNILSGHHHSSGLGLGSIEQSHEVSYLGNKILEQSSPVSDQCRADKYALEYEGTLRLDHSLPKLDQFTLCNWMRFTNHTGDHTIFTYSASGSDREIQLWIANTKEASFISLAVHGQSLYRLNYPFRYGLWHHQCTSWNSKTGEWQLWIKGERIGRGFHNRLVGYTIKPGGSLVAGGPSITGPTADGLHTELTMFQMYKVALSAGKAHRDHKHHHVHKFGHNGPEMTTQAPPPAFTGNPQPANPLLANGQIPSRVRLNLAGVQNQPHTDTINSQAAFPVQGLPSQLAGNALPTITTQFVNGQFHTGTRIRAEQLLGIAQPAQQQQQSHFSFPQSQSQSQGFPSGSYIDVGNQPANVQYIDGNSGSHFVFKRQNTKSEKKITKRESEKDQKTISKRGLVMLSDGQIVDDGLLDTDPFEFDGLAQFAGPDLKDFLTKQMDVEDDIKEYDREPAEGEVQAVMGMCSYCDEEPFLDALVLAWKNVKVTMQHAIRAKTQGGCAQF